MNIRQSFQTLYRRIAASGFLKSVLTLSSGVVVGQSINFLGMPAVGRLYSPAAMGDYTIIITNASVIMSVASLGMMTAFMLPEKDEEARGLTRLVTLSTLVITSLSILGLWVCSGFYRIFHTVETPYALSLFILWLYIVLYTISNICYAYVNRQKFYRVMFWNPIITAGINVGFGILFGFLGWGFLGCTAAHILSFAANILHLIYHANPYERVSDPAFRCLPLLKSYRRFPVYQMPSNLVANVGRQIPVQLMEAAYSSAALGMYSMAKRILSLPVSLLATPINRVYFREASQRYTKGESIGVFSFKILETNIKIAIAPIALLIVFGPQIFSVFLGAKWRQAGACASILGVYELMQFCSSCLSGDFVIIRKNFWNLVDAFFDLAIGLFLLILQEFFVPLSMVGFLALFSLLSSLKIISFQAIFLRYTGFPLRRYLFFILKYILIPFALSIILHILVQGGISL